MAQQLSELQLDLDLAGDGDEEEEEEEAAEAEGQLDLAGVSACLMVRRAARRRVPTCAGQDARRVPGWPARRSNRWDLLAWLQT